jgi:uncharacterized damage-inducible protein DinB
MTPTRKESRMPTTAENQKRFDEAFRVADEARARTLALLRRVSQADSEKRPEPGAWSIGEIAHHLILVDIRTTAQFLESVGTGKTGEYTPEQVQAARPFPLPDIADVTKSGKGKAPAAIEPSPGQDLRDLTDRLERARQIMRAELRRFRDRDLGVLFVPHARMGPLTLYERIAFTGYHEQKHIGQMERTVERVGARLS